jgi:hypothetical protein
VAIKQIETARGVKPPPDRVLKWLEVSMITSLPPCEPANRKGATDTCTERSNEVEAGPGAPRPAVLVSPLKIS